MLSQTFPECYDISFKFGRSREMFWPKFKEMGQNDSMISDIVKVGTKM